MEDKKREYKEIVKNKNREIEDGIKSIEEFRNQLSRLKHENSILNDKSTAETSEI